MSKRKKRSVPVAPPKQERNVDVVMADALESDNTRSAKRLREHIERDKVIIFERSE